MCSSDLSIEEMRDAIVEDAFDTCLNDSGYLKYILQDYFSDISEEMIRKNYADMRDTDWQCFGDRLYYPLIHIGATNDNTSSSWNRRWFSSSRLCQ